MLRRTEVFLGGLILLATLLCVPAQAQERVAAGNPASGICSKHSGRLRFTGGYRHHERSPAHPGGAAPIRYCS